MEKQKIRFVVFLLLVFFLFFLFVKAYEYSLIVNSIGSKDIKLFGVSALYTIIIIGLFYLARLHAPHEGFTEPIKPCMCKGGAYLYQGDSARSQMCRELLSTEQGRKLASDCQCKSGQAGRPGILFNYTPDSNNQWENERCPGGSIPGVN